MEEEVAIITHQGQMRKLEVLALVLLMMTTLSVMAMLTTVMVMPTMMMVMLTMMVIAAKYKADD